MAQIYYHSASRGPSAVVELLVLNASFAAAGDKSGLMHITRISAERLKFVCLLEFANFINM